MNCCEHTGCRQFANHRGGHDPTTHPTPVEDAQSGPVGMKFDDAKLAYTLVDPFASMWIAAVLLYGAETYARENWRVVPDAVDRYTNALVRHLELWRAGEQDDNESSLPHLAHVAVNAIFLVALVLPRDLGVLARRAAEAVRRARAAKAARRPEAG